jgi:hypothetical protein
MLPIVHQLAMPDASCIKRIDKKMMDMSAREWASASYGPIGCRPDFSLQLEKISVFFNRADCLNRPLFAGG